MSSGAYSPKSVSNIYKPVSSKRRNINNFLSARDADLNMVSTEISNVYQLSSTQVATESKWNPDQNYKNFKRVSLQKKLEFETFNNMKNRLISSTKNSEMKTILKQMKSRNNY